MGGASGEWPATKRSTSVSSTPGKTPGGMTASRWEWALALGQTWPCQRRASSGGGWVQHRGSGQRETRRCAVSRPRIQRTWSKGTPRLTENLPAGVCSATAVHQKVPRPVSVYCA